MRDLRKARNMTLDELAARVGTTKGYLSQIETGARKPSIDMLRQIAEALGSDAGAIISPDFPRRLASKIAALDPQEAEEAERFLDYLLSRRSSRQPTPER